MTKVEAAVMVQNILELPVPDASAVFSANESDTVPAWAQQAHTALTNAGFQLNIDQEDEPMSRRDAANILYRIHSILQSSDENKPYFLQ